MIEQGIVKLVQGTAAVVAIAKTGGWLSELPKGTARPSWTYTTVSNPDAGGRTLTSVKGLRLWRVQVDCYGDTADDVVRLGKAIAVVLNGYRGTLSDADSTIVDSAFLSDLHDPEFDDASRTWRRVLEFEVNYVSQF